MSTSKPNMSDLSKGTLPNLWFFNSPFIAFGVGALDFFEKIPGSRWFIVTDPGVIKVKLLDKITAKLKQYGRKWDVFSEVEPDPGEAMILRGLDQCKQFQPEIIVALGGGSSIDTAKAIWIMYEQPDLKFDDMNPFRTLNLGKKAKLVAIPTTSGTGAEATWAMVVTRTLQNGEHIKLELANKEAVPTYAILEPALTTTLPKSITIATAMDALSHAFEALISLWRNDFCDALALKATQLIRQYLPIVIAEPQNMQAREKLQNAACMAGLTISNAQVMQGHSIGHAIGATFGIPHGYCVGVVLPIILEFSIKNKDKITENAVGEFAKQLGVAAWTDTMPVAAAKMVADIRALQVKAGFPSSLKEAGIKEDQFNNKLEEVVEKTMEAGSSALGPRPADAGTYKKLIQYAWDGKAVDF